MISNRKSWKMLRMLDIVVTIDEESLAKKETDLAFLLELIDTKIQNKRPCFHFCTQVAYSH